MNLLKSLLSAAIFLLLTVSASGQEATAPPTENYPMMDINEPREYIIKDIFLYGATFQDPEILIMMSGFERGDTLMLPGNAFSDASRKLWSQRRFSDIRIDAETEGNEAIIYIYLTERPVVYNWYLEGVKKGEEKELRESLNLRRGLELSDFRINSSLETIRKFYRNKSYLNVEVDVIQSTDTLRDNAVNVTFVIHKGEKVKIGKIDFTGNEVFTDRRLKRTFKKTKQKSINFLVSSRFTDARFEEDQDNLIEFYNSKGYRNMRILSDSIYTINQKRLGIVVDVEEGDRFYYRNVSWLGNSKFDTEYLSNILAINKGDIYDNTSTSEKLGIGKYDNPDRISVSTLYQNNGYIFAQIEPQEIIVGQDSIDLEIKIIEGKQATINNVTITGNERVNDHVIRREIDVRPGELYNRSLLVNSIRRLSYMGHFDETSVASPGLNPISNELVDITFPLVEQASDQFEISGGWGANMFVGSVGVVLTNVSIGDFFKKGAWRPYPHGNNQQLSFRAQTNGKYYKSFSIGFTEPWLGGKKPNSLSVNFYYSDQTDAYYVWQSGNKHFRTLGGSVGLGKRLQWPDYLFTLYTELMYQAYNLKDWDNFLVKNGTSNIIGLRVVLGRNSTDQQTFPTTGSNFALSMTLTPPYSLFDGKDYSKSSLTNNERYRFIEFHKWRFSADWYHPLSNDSKLVLRTSADFGFIGSYDKYKPSPFEGYQVGGDGMSGYNLYGVDIIGLRGYDNGSLTPSNNYSRAYHKYTLEMRYLFVQSPATTVFGLVFAEGGNAFSEVKYFDPFNVKRSLGAGLRIQLPMLGILGVDWGYGFDKDIQGRRGGSQPHFVIGQQF